jgi:hypothetical protein
MKAIWKKEIAQHVPSSHQKHTIAGAVCSCQASDFGSGLAVKTTASNLSSQSNPIDKQITSSQRSAEPVKELAGPKSESPTHRTSMHHKVADVKIRLLMLWHASLSRSRQQARSWKVFWRYNDHQR